MNFLNNYENGSLRIIVEKRHYIHFGLNRFFKTLDLITTSEILQMEVLFVYP